MIVRGIDLENDWLFGKGRNDYNSNLIAVRQNIRTRLQSFLGDCFFAVNAGIDWFNLLGSKNQLALELAVRATLLNTANVTGIVSATVILDPNTRIINMQYTVQTAFGDQATGTITDTTALLVTESGDLITTEDGFSLSLG